MAATAREAALTALEKWRKNSAWSDAALASVIAKAQLDARDAALASRICYGTLQNLALLDFYIAAFSTTPPQKLEPKVLDLLRISAYQILLMDKVPPSAAVNEAVALCKRIGCARASGLVNAVLRRISEHRDSLPEIPGKGTAEYLATKYSHPLWLVQEWAAAHGYAFAEAALRADNAPAPVCIQTNTLKTDVKTLQSSLQGQGFAVRTQDRLPDALVCGGGNLTASDAFRDGWFYVQDAAAKLAVLAADPQPGMRVLDACAAPGGKSFSAAVQMQGRGSILSCDIHENKLKRVRESAQRLGISILETAAMDARTPLGSLRESADVVLADVPCSGLGVIRKKPEIRYKDPVELENLPEIQSAILSGLADCVKPGGVLLYSTCTVRQRENEDVVRAFLAGRPEFAPEPFSAAGVDAPDGMCTLWPHLHETDGFFICKLRKRV